MYIAIAMELTNCQRKANRMASITFHHTSEHAGPLEVRDSTPVCADPMCLGLAWHEWLSCDVKVDGILESCETLRTATTTLSSRLAVNSKSYTCYTTTMYCYTMTLC